MRQRLVGRLPLAARRLTRRAALVAALLGVPSFALAAPSIASLSPTSGAVGAAVTIAGSGFGSSQGSSTVKFNGTTATVTSWTSTSIVATVPSGATTGTVVVRVSSVNSNGLTFTVVAAPAITSLSPASGAVGAAVTVTGTNFGSTQGTGTVKFNGTTATVTSWNATTIATAVPSGATTGTVVVRTSGVNSPGVTFTVAAAPTITNLSPTAGAVGASVTVTGTNFGSTQGTGTVKVNGTTATVTSWNATTIVTTVPTGATTGSVVVRASGVDSPGVTFTVVAAPAITSLSPTSGAVGAAVTVTGTNFGSTQGTGTVKVNGISASVVSWSATHLTMVVPTGATTGSVLVSASGVNSNSVPFTVVPAPNITGVSPASGAVGTLVSIAGGNFGVTQGSSVVRFGLKAVSPVSWSANTIVVAVPADANGEVLIRANGASSNTMPFTLLATLIDTIVSAQPGPNGYVGGVSAVLQRPRGNPLAPRTLEVRMEWTHFDGRTFAVDHFTLPDVLTPTTAAVHDSVVTHLAPPWRVLVTLQERLGVAPAASPVLSCNSDRPFAGQPSCATPLVAPALGGTLLSESSAEITVPGLP